MDSYGQLPDSVSVIVDWPPGLPSFAFVIRADDPPDAPELETWDFGVRVADYVSALLSCTTVDDMLLDDDPEFEARTRPVLAAWQARHRPPLAVGALVTVTGHGRYVVVPGGWDSA